ncbi:MAG: nucleoside-diphosphate kinase [Armatimonadota bacterium]|nr:nucleoside-diphosphate kinase [Armatimonadota bacterium]
MERTFIMIKPDGVERRLVGEIIRRFENRGFDIIALKMLTMSRDLAEKHYEAHKGKPFYAALLEFITSGPVVAMVLQAENAVTLARQMMGALNPLDAAPGTIRGDFTTDTRKNLIHGADCPEAARREIALWFPELALDS